MAATDIVKDLVKPPFANYDVVVYFGCGLFALPLINHYLGEHKVHFMGDGFGFEPPFLEVLISTLVLLFSVYILGHIIAYTSSIFIEKVADAFFGKVSTVILLASNDKRGGPNSLFRDQLGKGWKASFRHSTWLSGTVRILAHLPVLIPYALLAWAGVFGFYRTRMPRSVMEAADTKLQAISELDCRIMHDTKWYKPLEQFVIANHAGATARMYNYLIISGLFRSLSFLFLVCVWFEAAYLVIRTFHGTAPLGVIMDSQGSWLSQLMSVATVTLVYIFSLFSYLKFQRRYVEEAIFAFVLTKD